MSTPPVSRERLQSRVVDTVCASQTPFKPLACSLWTISCHLLQPLSQLQRAASSRLTSLLGAAHRQRWGATSAQHKAMPKGHSNSE